MNSKVKMFFPFPLNHPYAGNVGHFCTIFLDIRPEICYNTGIGYKVVQYSATLWGSLIKRD